MRSTRAPRPGILRAMRALLPLIVPWLCMVLVVSTVYVLEHRRMRAQAGSAPDGSPPRRGPNLRLHLPLVLVLGPLLASWFFYSSRGRAFGLFLGLALKTTVLTLVVGVAWLTRNWVLASTLAAAERACFRQGPLAASADAVTNEGPCGALVTAYETGVVCLDGDRLVVCGKGPGLPVEVDVDHDKASRLLGHRCKRRELFACMGALERAGETEPARTEARAGVRDACCTFWRADVCEQFLRREECAR